MNRNTENKRRQGRERKAVRIEAGERAWQALLAELQPEQEEVLTTA